MRQKQIAERRIGNVTVLKLTGRLVLGEGDQVLRERIDTLLQEGRIHIVLNLHDVSYVDSCGVGVLAAKYLSVHKRGGTLKLVCPSERCRHVLSITHLLPMFDLYDSDEAAIRSCAPSDPVLAHS